MFCQTTGKIALGTTGYSTVRPRLYGENLFREERSLHWASQLFLRFLQNLATCLHEKQKAWFTLFGGRVTLPAGPTFLHINTLIHPAGSTRSRRDNQSMREHCCQLLAQAKGSFFLSYKHSLSWLGWENVPLSRDNFSLYKRVLKLYLHCILIKRRQRGWAVIALDLLSGSPQNAKIK